MVQEQVTRSFSRTPALSAALSGHRAVHCHFAPSEQRSVTNCLTAPVAAKSRAHYPAALFACDRWSAAVAETPASLCRGLRATIAATSHLLRHRQQKLPVGVAGFAQALCQFMKVHRLFARTPPNEVIRGFPFC
jgi:hypothetical protein